MEKIVLTGAMLTGMNLMADASQAQAEKALADLVAKAKKADDLQTDLDALKAKDVETSVKAIGYNTKARHIVYVGGTEKDNLKIAKDTRTPAQGKAMEEYVKDFLQRFPKVKIVGHNELAIKDCPSFDVQQWLKKIGINQ